MKRLWKICLGLLCGLLFLASGSVVNATDVNASDFDLEAYLDQAYASGGHVYSDWIYSKEPTCTSEGERYKVCIAHDHGGQIIEELPMIDHQYVEEITPATCIEREKHTFVCSMCGKTYEEEVGEPLGHDFHSAVTTPAACEMEGVLTYTCSRCGEQYTEIIPMLEHKYGDWIVEMEPKAGIQGVKYRECEYCHERIYKYTPALLSSANMVTMKKPVQRERVSTIDKAMVCLDFVILIIFIVIIRMDLVLILWSRRKRKEYEKKADRIRRFGDNCGFS